MVAPKGSNSHDIRNVKVFTMATGIIVSAKAVGSQAGQATIHHDAKNKWLHVTLHKIES